MNESTPGAFPFDPTPEAVPYKDQYPGLVIFGILTILLGCLCGLFMLFLAYGMVVGAAAAKAPGAPANTTAILPIVGIYGLLAVVLIWLGIGSIMARRWARAILLIWSWVWLIFGTVGGVAAICILPGFFRSIPAGGGPGHPVIPVDPILIFVTFIITVIFIALPLCWVLFYRSPHVKATCEARSPGDSWTDACPLPVLGLCLWLGFSVPMLLIMPVMMHGVVPFFGTFLTGFPGGLFYLVMAGVWGWAAWSLYHLESRGWWVTLIGMAVYALSSVITYAFHSPLEMYQLMGYPDAQIQQMQKLGFLSGNSMVWITLISMLPVVLYLFWVKRYLPRNE